MSEFRPSTYVPLRNEAVHCHGSRDCILLGLVLIALVRTSAALAGDQFVAINAKIDPAPVNFGRFSPAAMVVTPTPGIFTMPTSGGVPVFSSTEFRPRGHMVLDKDDPAASALGEAPLIHYTTVWQRLSEYKSHDRVRLLTLWESSDSSVSLQAGKRGDASLQWTSRLMNRGGSTRGLLDRFLSVSLAGASGGVRNSSRSANAVAAPKAVPPAVVAGLK
ncbi:MAG: hypothetical protein ABJC66_02270 [Gammaproteobacteria bacterium]